jgi:hypothetical protein
MITTSNIVLLLLLHKFLFIIDLHSHVLVMLDLYFMTASVVNVRYYTVWGQTRITMDVVTWGMSILYYPATMTVEVPGFRVKVGPDNCLGWCAF